MPDSHPPQPQPRGIIRHAWAVLADPPGSDTARLLRNIAIPIWALFAALSLLPFWEGPLLSRFADLVWMVALLYVVRQRDNARTQLAALRRARTPR